MYEDNKEIILSDCIDAGHAVEAYSIEDQKGKLVLAHESFIDHTKTALEESTGWLPMFAELYNISPDIKDYILVPVAIMPSDLPNRNAQSFPLDELTRPDPESGLLAYESWKRKPTFKDHKNKLGTDQPKGIILSSTIVPIRGAVGNLWKVVCLLAYDRRGDAILANDILTGNRPSYSMGAWSRFFTCSVCGGNHTSKEAHCDHVSAKFLKMRVMPDNKLAYLQARYPTGFEVSSVEKPAYAIAVTTPEYHLR
jgi:hypothetical protein